MQRFAHQAALTICFAALLFATSLFHPPFSPAADTNEVTAAGEKADHVMAGLSDEQVRKMLIDELKKDAKLSEPDYDQMKGPASLLSVMLNSLSSGQDEDEDQLKALFNGIPNVLPDLYRVFIKLCPYGTSQGAMLNILWVALYLLVGLGIETLFRKFVITRYLTEPDFGTTEMSATDKFLAALAQNLPRVLGLIFFFGASYFSYMAFIWTNSPFLQLFFLATLLCVTCIRSMSILCHIFFSPEYPQLRIIPLEDAPARASHRLIVWTFGYIIVALMFAVVTRRLGAGQETVRLLQLLFATVLLITTAFIVISERRRVGKMIIVAGLQDKQSVTWGRKQFAAVWHILALFYLFILWILLVGDLADPSVKGGGAFILSFFVVPIWMVADRLIQWVVKYSMSTLKIHQDSYPDKTAPTELDLRGEGKGSTYVSQGQGNCPNRTCGCADRLGCKPLAYPHSILLAARFRPARFHHYFDPRPLFLALYQFLDRTENSGIDAGRGGGR